ncbi:L-fuculose kinase [Spirochaetia bacterium]|nr:L-fuculose kinase [Spirochaetia bacterium]
MHRDDYVIAVDFGASGGKMAAVRLGDQGVNFIDTFSFPNIPLQLGAGLYWDIAALYRSILEGCSFFAAKYGKPLSIGIDTWGASYGFLDKKGRLAEPVYHYRDLRTDGAIEALYKRVSKWEIFELTGCQCASSYTLVQLFAVLLEDDGILDRVKHLLPLPDLLSYFLGGDISAERTIAGTTAMTEPAQNGWSYELLQKLNIPTAFLPPLVKTGSIKGTLNSRIANETGLGSAPIVAAVAHDSAAAVAAIPGFDQHSLYISIGTQISLGTYGDTPALDDAYYRGGFKNTGSADGRIIIYRDFPAAWMINRVHAEWIKTGERLSFDDLDTLAAKAERGSLFNIEAPVIQEAGGIMSRAIEGLIKDAGQDIPRTKAEFIRSVMESIALRVRYYARKLAEARGFEFTKIWIISGGTRYKTLVQLIADALGRPVYTGLPYATLTGNAVSQFSALGKLELSDYGFNKSVISAAFTERENGPGRDWRADMEWAIARGILG